MTHPPDPDALHPVPGDAGTVLLRPLLARRTAVKNVTAGDYSYCHDQRIRCASSNAACATISGSAA